MRRRHRGATRESCARGARELVGAQTNLTRLPGEDPLHVLAEECLTGEQVAGFVEQRLPRPSQRDPAAGPLEERDSELGFEASNQLADSRLSDVETAGRPPEMQLLGYRHEGAEMSQLHLRIQARLLDP
jgi:hypothetical protein